MKLFELKDGKLEPRPKSNLQEVAQYYSAMRYGDKKRCLKFLTNSNLAAVYRINERIVGAIRATSDEVRFAYLIDLFVHPKSRKKGIGSSLLLALCRYYGEMKVDYIELDTDPADPGLNEFYKKCGLKEEKKSKVFYWNHKTKI